jgi:hypothetical protein
MTTAKSPQHRPSITIHLSYPVTHDGKSISELTLRRPTVADQLASVVSVVKSFETALRAV